MRCLLYEELLILHCPLQIIWYYNSSYSSIYFDCNESHSNAVQNSHIHLQFHGTRSAECRQCKMRITFIIFTHFVLFLSFFIAFFASKILSHSTQCHIHNCPSSLPPPFHVMCEQYLITVRTNRTNRILHICLLIHSEPNDHHRPHSVCVSALMESVDHFSLSSIQCSMFKYTQSQPIVYDYEYESAYKTHNV